MTCPFDRPTPPLHPDAPLLKKLRPLVLILVVIRGGNPPPPPPPLPPPRREAAPGGVHGGQAGHGGALARHSILMAVPTNSVSAVCGTRAAAMRSSTAAAPTAALLPHPRRSSLHRVPGGAGFPGSRYVRAAVAVAAPLLLLLLLLFLSLLFPAMPRSAPPRRRGAPGIGDRRQTSAPARRWPRTGAPVARRRAQLVLGRQRRSSRLAATPRPNHRFHLHPRCCCRRRCCVLFP